MSGPERAASWWHQEAAGGGAMLDYCCYGAMVSHWYIGEPGVCAVGMKANLNSKWGDANDNAAMIIRFPNAMALLEGSWTTWDHGVPTGPIVYGTTGTLVVESKGGKAIVRLERGHGDTTIYEAEAICEDRDDVAKELVHHLETGEPVHETLSMMFNLNAMAILAAGAKAAGSGKVEPVQNMTWCIG